MKRIYLGLFAAILLCSFALKMSYNLNYSGAIFDDQVAMSDYAKHIAATGEYPLRMQTAAYTTQGIYWSPGYIYFMAAFIKIAGYAHHFEFFRFIQILLSLIALIGFFWLADMLFGRKTAYLSLLILAFYPPLILLTGTLYVENLFIALMPFVFVSLVKWQQNPRGWLWPILAGVLFSLAHLTRPVLIPLPFLFVLWVFLTYSRPLFVRFLTRQLPIFAISAILVLMPWIIHNYKIYGAIITSSSVGGLNFYIGNNEKANGNWVAIDDPQVAKLVGTPAGDSLAYHKGLHYMFTHPAHEVHLLLNKTLKYTLGLGYEKNGQGFWGAEASRLWKDAYQIPSIPISVLFAAFVLFICFFRKEWRVWFLPITYTIGYMGMLIVLYKASRYRLIIEPVLVICLAALALYCYRKWRLIAEEDKT